MRVYIAAPFIQREAAKAARYLIQKKGHVSIARWIDTHLEEGDLLTPETKAQEALEDIQDILQSDAVLILDDFPCSMGRHFEMGFAYGMGIPIYVVGRPWHIFHQVAVALDRVDDFPNLEDTDDGY